MHYVVRRVLPYEYRKYREHLKLLDADSRKMRFSCHVTDNFIDKICDQIESVPENHVLFCIENDNLEFVAMGHIIPGKRSEIALSVLKKYQKKGMGSALMKRVIHYCKTHGIFKGYMICLQSNHAILKLCKKHKIKIHSEYGESTGMLDLDFPSFDTFVNETTFSTLEIMDFFSKRSLFTWSLMLDTKKK